MCRNEKFGKWRSIFNLNSELLFIFPKSYPKSQKMKKQNLFHIFSFCNFKNIKSEFESRRTFVFNSLLFLSFSSLSISVFLVFFSFSVTPPFVCSIFSFGFVVLLCHIKQNMIYCPPKSNLNSF